MGRGRAGANAYLAQAAALRAAILGRLWDPQVGAFIGNTDDRLRNHTQDAQAEAILGGLTTQSQSQQALRFIDSNLLTPFGVANGQFDDDPVHGQVHLALHLRDGGDGALLGRRCKGRAQPDWPDLGGGCLHVGPGTVWERMRLDGVPNSGAVSLAHGWSAGPAACPLRSTRSASGRRHAGYRHWVVAPQPGYLRFAQGEAPTPRGPIASRWRRGGHSFKLTVSAPRGTSGVVELPLLRRPRKVLRDGKVVWSRGRRAGKRGKRRGGVIKFRKVAGQHTFLVR